MAWQWCCTLVAWAFVAGGAVGWIAAWVRRAGLSPHSIPELERQLVQAEQGRLFWRQNAYLLARELYACRKRLQDTARPWQVTSPN